MDDPCYGTRPKPKNLTTDDQVAILNLLRDGASPEYLAKAYDRSLKTIRRIQRLETMIRKRHASTGGYTRNGKKKKKSHFPKRINSSDATLMKVERVLETWLRENFESNVGLSYVEIRDKALALYAMYKPPGVAKPGQEVVFKASKSWLYRLKKRLRLDNYGRNLFRYDNEIIEIDDDMDDDYDDDGPSTSAHSSSKNDMHESVYSITDEESNEGDTFHDDGDLEDEVANNRTLEGLNVHDTLVQEEVEPLTVDLNKHFPTTVECELFGEYVAKHLQQLPVEMALKLQSGIQTLVMTTRLEYIRQHPNEAPNMVKDEPPPDDEDDADRTRPSDENDEDPLLTRMDQPHRETPAAKRFKPNPKTPRSESRPQTTTTRKKQSKNRTDCTVFAEHIAVQLEQLPEELSLQLQSDIYTLINQASTTKPAPDDAHNRVKIKAENIEVSPTEISDEFYEVYEEV